MAVELSKSPDHITFGDDFVLDLRAYELRSHGIRLGLERIPLELLLLLIERAGQLVTREQIAERIWGKGVFLDSDNGINCAISKLRQALRDDSERPRLIQTVIGKGYRFIAPIIPVSVPSVSVPLGNLPPQRSRIIGRELEIEELCGELRLNRTRLLTLTGVGGAGKTTLAQAVARELVRDFPDGISFVDLSVLKEPELVAPTIGQALGIKDADRNLTALKEQLRGRKMLLVLDNFEQVLSAGPFVAELLATTLSLKVLITSRARLHLRDEREYIVPALAVPEPAVELSASESGQYAAVELFTERARAVQSNFEITNENALAVARICARVDGLPLAIELAAARVKLLSPQAILSRLDRRLKLLTGGARDLPRQQTMSAAIAWSYELLGSNEQHVFQRLAIFAGGFTLEATEKILADADVLDKITSLVNQSLLAIREGTDGDRRFYMLEVVREYALDRLEGSGDADAMQKQHATYFVELAEEAESHLRGSQPAKWFSRVEEEYENIRAALRWALQNDRITAARIAAGIRYYWVFRGYLSEGASTIKQILAEGQDLAWTLRWKLLSVAGNFATFQGDYQTARNLYEQGLREAQSAADLTQVSLFCRGLGGLAFEQGDDASAVTFIEQALSAARKSGDAFGISASLNKLGDLARSAGDYKAALPLFHDALATRLQLGRKYAAASTLINLASAEYGLGDYWAAKLHFAEGLTMAVEAGNRIAGDRIVVSNALDGFAALAAQRGDTELGATLAGAAEHLRETMNYNIERAEHSFRNNYLAQLHTLLSPQVFSAAHELGRNLKLEESVALALGDTKNVVFRSVR